MLTSRNMHESAAEKCGNVGGGGLDVEVDSLDVGVGDLGQTTRLLVGQNPREMEVSIRTMDMSCE